MSIESYIIPVLTQFGFILLWYFLIFRPAQKRDYDVLLMKYIELEDEHAKALRDIEALKAENRELRDKIHLLQIENQRLQRQVDRLNAGLIAALVSIPTVVMLVVMIMQHRQG